MRKTSESPVKKFGDFSFMGEPIGDFEGTINDSVTLTETLMAKATHFYKQALITETSITPEIVD